MNLLLLIFRMTPHGFNTTHHKTTLLAHISTELQETTPPIIQSTPVTRSITRTTLSSASSSFLHDYNVSMTSNDSTAILTTPVFNMTDLTTAVLEPGIVTSSLNVTDALGTKHGQLIYMIIIALILFICTLLSVYVVIKKNRNYQRMHILHHPSNTHIELNDEPEDSVIEFELRRLKKIRYMIYYMHVCFCSFFLHKLCMHINHVSDYTSTYYIFRKKYLKSS